MREIYTLADTGTADIHGVIPTVWSKKIEEAARPKRVFRDHIRLDTSLLNKAGEEVRIPRRSELTAAAIAEGGTITPSTLTYGTALVLHPTEFGVAVSLTRQAVERANENLIEAATGELAQALAQVEDITIRNAINEATSNILYGGDATGTADLEAGDVLTPELLTRAGRELRKNDWTPTDVFMAPEQQYSLGTWAQFTDAAKWGDQTVLKTGQVPSWMGMKIFTTTNCPSGLGGISTAIAYHIIFCMDSEKAAALAVKRNPTVDVQYEPLSRKRTVAATMDFDAGIANDSAIVKIIVSDS